MPAPSSQFGRMQNCHVHYNSTSTRACTSSSSLPLLHSCFRSSLVLLALLRLISPIVLPFNLLDNLLHLLRLPLPFRLAHLRFPPEQLVIRLPVAPAQPIPQRRELSVVVVEVQMVHRMARCAIHNNAVADVFAIVYQDRPDVDEDEQDDICILLEREHEREEMIRHALAEPIDRVECM